MGDTAATRSAASVGEVALGHHAVGAPGRVAPREASGARIGIEAARVGDQPGEERRLRDVELGDAHAEVGLGAGLHAVGAVAEVHGVQVALEDLVLRHDLLEAPGQHRLAGLAVDGLRVADQLLLHDLLGDGRAALHGLALVDVADQGSHGGAQVHAVVGVEVGVLHRQHGVDGVLRDLRQRHRLPVDLRLEGGEQRAVGGVHVAALVERTEVDHRLVGAARRRRSPARRARGPRRRRPARRPRRP